MPDARWSDVDADLASAETHFARAGEIYDPDEMAGEGLDAYKTRMAFMHAMHAGYSSVENALVRIFAMLDEELPSGPSWHADLLNRAARPIPDSRPAILGHDMKTDLDALRRFRHVADHTYDDFRPKEAVTAVEAARRAASTALRAEIQAFREIIDPPDPSSTPSSDS